MSKEFKLIKVSQILCKEKSKVMFSIKNASANIQTIKKRLSTIQGYLTEYNSISYQQRMAHIPGLYKNFLLFVKKIEKAIIKDQKLVSQLEKEEMQLFKELQLIDSKITALQALLEKQECRERYVLEKNEQKLMDELLVVNVFKEDIIF